MAKKPRINPSAEFARSSADIIKAVLTSAYAPIARLASVQAFEAAQDRIADLLRVSPSAYDRSDFRPLLVQIGEAVKQVKETKEYRTLFKKDRNGYTFTMFKKEGQGGELVFSTQIAMFPGASIPRFRTDISGADKASVVWAMMAAAGFQFTPQGDEFFAYYTPDVIREDPKGKQKRAEREEIDLATSDMTGITGLVDVTGAYANFLHTQPIMNAAFQCTIRYRVTVAAGFANNIVITIAPIVDISLSNDLVPYMAETNDKSANDFLVYTWMNDAISRATKGGRGKTKSANMPAVDLRLTSDKLNKVAAKFDVAKPRLNKYGFCITGQGMPMYVPAIDKTADFMRDHANFEVGDDGYMRYEDAAHLWASSIVLVDWFNDVIVYTTTDGHLAVSRMLGFIPLDTSSEYVMLNTRLIDRRWTGILQNLCKIVDQLVTPQEAEAELPVELRAPDAYNAGKILQKSFTNIMNDLRVRPLTRNLDPKDKEFPYASSTNALIKHIFGVDTDELPAYEAGMAQHAAAWLRAASKPAKKRDITMAMMNRLVGVEYFLRMAPIFFKDNAFEDVRKEWNSERDRRKNQPLLADIDVPNLDAGYGKGLQAWQPHQIRNFSNMSSGANTGLATVSTGGGKTLLQLVDILLSLEKNPKWRPLVITKPRLVKNMIAEINWATKGKVNVVSLRRSQLAYLKTQLGINSAEGLLKWVRSFPPNTIFICGYTDFSRNTQIYTDLEVPDRVLLHDVALPQFLHLLRIIGFDIMRCDESHSIKNLASRRSRYSFSLLAQAKSKTLLSGTTVNNTAVDLLGQGYALNPMMFGDNVEEFKEEYNLPGGLIKTDEASFKLNTRLRLFTQVTTATEEDWAFLLPDLFDSVIAPEMTPKQAEFYAILMKRAEIELRAKTGADENADDDEADDEEESEEAFLMKLDAALVHVEQFLVAPDKNLEYVNWSKKPTGDDLISPCVRAIDGQLARVYADRAADHTNNKTAVFGINKVASDHFMRHTKFRDLCMHYKAGDEEVIRQWKANPDVYILVADSTSIREGENMQMLSRIYDMQATWTPGDFKQLLARMYRPDPKGVYAKDRVDHYWVVPNHKGIQPSLATVKLARMISKTISLARFRYQNDPRWAEISHQFDDLDLLTMNLETVFESTHNDLAPYFTAYSQYVSWEREINIKARIRLAEEVEAETGLRLVDDRGNVLDRALFLKSVMKEAKSTKVIPGTKRVFVPWERGALPADMHGMFLTMLGKDKIERGAFVLTEYGPGIVQNVGDNQLDIELFGRKKVKLYRDRVAVPNGEGVQKMDALIRNPSAWGAETFVKEIASFTNIHPDDSLAPKGGKGKTPAIAPTTMVVRPPPSAPIVRLRDLINAPKPPKVVEPEPEEDDEEEELTPISEDDIAVQVLNGMPALLLYDAPSGVENYGWQPLSAFTGVTFTSWATAESFIQSMAKKFAISKSALDTLYAEMEEFQQGKTLRLQKRVTEQQARNFFISNHRKLSQASDGRERVNPYWMAIGRNIYLAFSSQSHSQRVFTWLKTMVSKNVGKIKPLKEVDELHVNVFNTLAEAIADLKQLAEAFDIPESVVRRELRNIKEEIDDLKARKPKPSMTVKPALRARR